MLGDLWLKIGMEQPEEIIEQNISPEEDKVIARDRTSVPTDCPFLKFSWSRIPKYTTYLINRCPRINIWAIKRLTVLGKPSFSLLGNQEYFHSTLLFASWMFEKGVRALWEYWDEVWKQVLQYNNNPSNLSSNPLLSRKTFLSNS